MKIFRNPEIKLFTLIYSVISLIFITISYFSEPLIFLAALIFSITAFLIFIIFTSARYKRIERLTSSIDAILQGKESILISDMKEGEISALETQTEKMFIRLKEQKEILLKEKGFLADSIADLSHQLKTPLTSINLLLSRLHDSDITEEQREELLRELSVMLGRTEKLVTALLKLSKIDAGTIQFIKQEINAEKLTEKAVQPLLIPMDIKNITLVNDTKGVYFQGDFMWFTEALSNIIKNAVEHTPENGTVTVTAKENPIYTEITVKDTGEGFSEEDIPHIFERFYKGKNTAKESFGIGLNLAKTITENQNGTIKAYNSPEGGAEFIIKIYKSDETVI
ncbi:MAG: HAMP domain-containing histidine kinase [Ruminococcaceae bacterium]|nr:HAMP domain-containing histidine kinase [Oscillospiraceae bacterium]